MFKQLPLIILKSEILSKNLNMAFHLIFRDLLVSKVTSVSFFVVEIMCHSPFSQPWISFQGLRINNSGSDLITFIENYNVEANIFALFLYKVLNSSDSVKN